MYDKKLDSNNWEFKSASFEFSINAFAIDKDLRFMVLATNTKLVTCDLKSFKILETYDYPEDANDAV